jgi:3-methyladenine DNA glycosylase AlkC
MENQSSIDFIGSETDEPSTSNPRMLPRLMSEGTRPKVPSLSHTLN